MGLSCHRKVGKRFTIAMPGQKSGVGCLFEGNTGSGRMHWDRSQEEKTKREELHEDGFPYT